MPKSLPRCTEPGCFFLAQLGKTRCSRHHAHQWDEVHHTDDYGRHWCPTGYAICGLCGEMASDWIGTCTLWGKVPAGNRT
jgi:hypothetical protein